VEVFDEAGAEKPTFSYVPGRAVQVPSRGWDPYAFIDVCEEISTRKLHDSSLEREALIVQQEELTALFFHSLMLTHPSGSPR
jgi:hypothetical protein